MTVLPATAGPPSAAELGDPKRAKAWQAAQDFEAMAIGELLKPIFSTVDPSHGAFGGGEGESAWRPMLTQEIAKVVSRHGGLGLAAPVYQELMRSQETS